MRVHYFLFTTKEHTNGNQSYDTALPLLPNQNEVTSISRPSLNEAIISHPSFLGLAGCDNSAISIFNSEGYYQSCNIWQSKISKDANIRVVSNL